MKTDQMAANEGVSVTWVDVVKGQDLSIVAGTEGIGSVGSNTAYEKVSVLSDWSSFRPYKQ